MSANRAPSPDAQIVALRHANVDRLAQSRLNEPEHGGGQDEPALSAQAGPDHILAAIALANETVRGARLSGHAKIEATKTLAEHFVELLFTRGE